MKDWALAKETDLPVQEAAERIELAAAEKGLRVLHTHNMSETIRSKGFECPEYRIVEVCSAKYASQAVAIDPRIGLWLPCPIAVYAHEGKTHVAALRPTLIGEFFPGKELGGFPEAVEGILAEVLDAALAA
jgi:uncharacterized protein (DUF302 family)